VNYISGMTDDVDLDLDLDLDLEEYRVLSAIK